MGAAVLKWALVKNKNKKERENFMSYNFLLDLALILLSTKVLGLLTRRFKMP